MCDLRAFFDCLLLFDCLVVVGCLFVCFVFVFVVFLDFCCCGGGGCCRCSGG